MTEQRVSSRYAAALIDAAKQENILDAVFDDLRLVGTYIDASRELTNMLKSPVINHWKKKNSLTEIFEGKISTLTLNFLILLAEKRRESLCRDIIEQFVKQYNKFKGLLPVEITSANELATDIKNKITNKLNEITKMQIIGSYTIDKSIKGGVKIRIDDWVYDASLASQLDLLYKSLADA